LPGQRLRGPLFLAGHREGGQRLSKRNAIHCWHMFQLKHVSGCSRIYQLEDVVYTGRTWDAVSLSEHARISRRSAAVYCSGSGTSPEDIVAKLDSSRSSLRAEPRYE
jgi:hypothetical protein